MTRTMMMIIYMLVFVALMMNAILVTSNVVRLEHPSTIWGSTALAMTPLGLKHNGGKRNITNCNRLLQTQFAYLLANLQSTQHRH